MGSFFLMLKVIVLIHLYFSLLLCVEVNINSLPEKKTFVTQFYVFTRVAQAVVRLNTTRMVGVHVPDRTQVPRLTQP